MAVTLRRPGQLAERNVPAENLGRQKVAVV